MLFTVGYISMYSIVYQLKLEVIYVLCIDHPLPLWSDCVGVILYLFDSLFYMCPLAILS